ncbi:MAG: hypothetical protein K9W43_04865 [Candidatus Thorarchaeota archaeon]|nr:hypothetical protein [Candidatus Thorarchaeota archaeon]
MYKEIIDRISILFAFRTPFPFSYQALKTALSKIDFSPPEGNDTVMVIDSEGARHIIRRFVNAESEISFDEARGHIKIESQELAKLIEVANKFMKIIKDTPDFPEDLKWFELVYNSRILTDKHPMSTLWKEKTSTNILLDEITGLETRPYTKTICAYQGEPPTVPLNIIPAWLHISIGPFVPNPRYSTTNFVYRRESLEKVIEFSQRIPEIVTTLLNEM